MNGANAKKISLLEEFLALGEDSRAELIDGQIIQKALPSGEHGDIQSSIVAELTRYFKRKPKDDGTGGWWFATEVSIRYRQTERILQPDIVGWLRSNYPERPKGYPVEERPDWVCEVSFSTWKKDTTTVFETLESEGVPYYWIVDFEHKNLVVYELQNKKYHKIQSLFEDQGKARIKPFDAIELDISVLFGADAE